jgi:hypothetical protein
VTQTASSPQQPNNEVNMINPNNTLALTPATELNYYRTATVQRAYYHHQDKTIPKNRKPVSELRFKGIWLIEAGFKIGAKVTIQVTDGVMMITKE